MREDLGDHEGIYDGGDDRQGAAALGTVFHVDSEHLFEQPSPADAGWRREMGCVAVIKGGCRLIDGGSIEPLNHLLP